MAQKPFIKIFIGWFVVLLLLSGCTQIPFAKQHPGTTDSWTAADLRWISPYDETLSSRAMIAAYDRFDGEDLQIRLDLLDLDDPLSFDLILALDFSPGGSSTLPYSLSGDLTWELLAIFTPSEQPFIIGPDGVTRQELIPRIQRDVQNDTLVIQIPRRFILGVSATFRYQAFLIATENQEIISQTPAIKPSMTKPERAPLLLVFWNSFLAASPAQALRRWDGAHTSPIGQRHGLSVLLDQVYQKQISVTLLDLKNSQSLAALELLGKAEKIRILERERLISLPQSMFTPIELMSKGLAWNEAATADFSLNKSRQLFVPTEKFFPDGYQAYFVNLENQYQLVRWMDHLLIPLPFSYPGTRNPSVDAISQNGFSLQAKRALLKAANLRNSGAIVVLGGDLTTSLWADLSTCPLLFDYIANHPWIEALSENQLLQLPALQTDTWPLPGCVDLLCTPSTPSISPHTWSGNLFPTSTTSQDLTRLFINQLANMPDSDITKLTLLSLQNLTKIENSIERVELNANILPQIGYLLAAARWENNPEPGINCRQDLDLDGEPECTLTTANRFVIVEPQGGCLVFYARKDLERSNIILMPSGLVSPGLGDVSKWDFTRGPNSDLGALNAGLCSSTAEMPYYNFEVHDNSLSLVNEGKLGLTFLLTENYLQIQFGNLSSAVKLSFLVNSIMEGYSGGIGTSEQSQDHQGWAWKSEEYAVSISISPPDPKASIITSLDSKPFLTEPENPDRAYPPGHYLPFPYAVLSFSPRFGGMLTIQ